MFEPDESIHEVENTGGDLDHYQRMYDWDDGIDELIDQSVVKIKGCFGKVFSFFSSPHNEPDEDEIAHDELYEANEERLQMIEEATMAMKAQRLQLDAQSKQIEKTLHERGEKVTQTDTADTEESVDIEGQEMSHQINLALAKDISIPQSASRGEVIQLRQDTEEGSVQIHSLFSNYLDHTARRFTALKDKKETVIENSPIQRLMKN